MHPACDDTEVEWEKPAANSPRPRAGSVHFGDKHQPPLGLRKHRSLHFSSGPMSGLCLPDNGVTPSKNHVEYESDYAGSEFLIPRHGSHRVLKVANAPADRFD